MSDTMDLERGVQAQASRARLVRGLLVAAIVSYVVAIVLYVDQLSLLQVAANGGGISQAAAEANDARVKLVGTIQVLIFVVTGIAWLRWLHRAYANLRLIGTKRTAYTPGWAVGYWFVPVVNLYRPYQITKELWQRSVTGNAQDPMEGQSSPSLVAWWWGVWIIDGLVGRALLSQSNLAKTIPDLLNLTNMMIASSLGDVLSAILALVLVSRLAALQLTLKSPEGAA